MGNKISHFFQEDFEGLDDFFKGIGAGITGDFSNAGRDFKNVGHDWKNAYLGEHNKRELSPEEQANQIAKQNRINYNKAIDPNNQWNQVNWKSVSSTTSNAYYSQMHQTVKPSDLQKISDPFVKTAVAVSRGKNRDMVHLLASKYDISASSVLAPTTTTTSETITAAGGEGPQISKDLENPSDMKSDETVTAPNAS